MKIDNVFFQILKARRQEWKLAKFRKRWNASNVSKHNEIIPNVIFDMDTVSIGNYSYGELNITTFNNKSKLCIGNYVSIAQSVTFLLDVEHHMNAISTFPFKVKTLNAVEAEAFSKGDIIVEDDVWIGYGAIIFSGVTIGQGAVIAAGAIVTKDVPPYAIVGGVPAKVIKYRFSQNIIDKLIKIDFCKLTEDMVRKHIDELYETVDEETDLSWLPQKDAYLK